MATAINMVLWEPQSNWVPSLKFPALTGVKRYSVDVETRDPNVNTMGPGNIRKDGYPVGFSLALDTGFSNYYPFRHELGGNLPKEPVVSFFSDLLSRTDLEVVFANGGYDLGWLDFEGIKVCSPMRDVQLAEPLLDEEAVKGYNLNALCKKYLGKLKNEELLQLAAEAYSTEKKAKDTNTKEYLWLLHSKYVGPYATSDAEDTLYIHEKQMIELDKQGLIPLYNLECELMPIVHLMRQQGVRVDIDAAEKLAAELKVEETRAYKLLVSEIGWNIDVNSPQSIAKACGILGLPIPRTLKGNPSFDKVFLRNSDNKFFKQIQNIRNIRNLRSTFIEGIILHSQIRGRIHAEFNQLRKDDGGTASGRFSSQNPNLQQIPSRDKKIAPKIRSLFLPNEGEKWAKEDYSQQEPRLLVHYAYLMGFQGAGVMRDAYLNDKQTDFYTLLSKLADIDRSPAKIVTLAICYGEGKDKLARDLGISIAKAIALKEHLNQSNPYIQKMADEAMNQADRRGYIRTILGRRSRFNLWEPYNNYGDKAELPLPIDQANQKWLGKTKLRRAYCYKALNRIIQGSAADMTKAAMVQIYRELRRVPLLQVHDELDYSVPGIFEATQIQYRMENALDTKVPMYVDLHLGPHWK